MPEVGADVESICRKCGDVWHVVVAKVGDQIAKVQCKQCNGLHRHKPPGGAPIRRVSKASRARASSPTRPRGVPVSSKPLIEVDATKPLRPYRMTERYEVGDRVAHQMFGEGVVELLPGPHKVQVFFSDGRKILAHERNS